MLFKPFMRENFIPLPVALISTVSPDGIRNIAPYGCLMPILRPLDLMAVASAHRRDTLANIRATGEFVINLPGIGMADAVIPTARFSPPEADEFELAGLDPHPSTEIAPPGIAGCYAWMECRLDRLYEEKAYVLVIGKVVRLEVDDAALGEDGTLDLDRARPLMMTGSRRGMHFCAAAAIGRFEPFGAMAPGGRDPLAPLYAQDADE